jgi:hypothetical protein
VTTFSHLVLVLWGRGFDEIAASIFVAELRRLGKRVKLAGLNSQQIAGQHGVTLVPDLPLGQALRAAQSIQCIIVPAPLAALSQFSYDPRLAELLGLVSRQQTLLVVDASSPPAPGESSLLSRLTLSSSSQLSSFTSPASSSSSSSSSPSSSGAHESLQLLTYPAVTELVSFVHTALAPRLKP